jgi:hypothetical protein
MVLKTAKLGRGSCSLAKDVTGLEAMVVEALRKSFEPSLKNCSLTWGNEVIHYGEIFRD